MFGLRDRLASGWREAAAPNLVVFGREAAETRKYEKNYQDRPAPRGEGSRNCRSRALPGIRRRIVPLHALELTVLLGVRIRQASITDRVPTADESVIVDHPVAPIKQVVIVTTREGVGSSTPDQRIVPSTSE